MLKEDIFRLSSLNKSRPKVEEEEKKLQPIIEPKEDYDAIDIVKFANNKTEKNVVQLCENVFIGS